MNNRKKDSMTKTECQEALEHAEAFVLLVLSQDEKKYGEATRDWLDKYGGNLESQPQGEGI